MKKNNDIIVKYLSGLMSGNEAAEFEKDLSTSQALREQFDSVKNSLQKLDIKNIDADESYFVNLIPRVREKINKEKRYFIWKRIYYLAPALTIALLAIIFYPRTNVNNINADGSQNLIDVIINNIHNDEVTNKYLGSDLNLEASYDELSADTNYNVGLINSFSKIPDSYISSLDLSNTETRITLSSLDNSELEKLYNELNEIKFK